MRAVPPKPHGHGPLYRSGHPWQGPYVDPDKRDWRKGIPFPRYYPENTLDVFEEIDTWKRNLCERGEVPERYRGLKTIPMDEIDNGKPKPWMGKEQDLED